MSKTKTAPTRAEVEQVDGTAGPGVAVLIGIDLSKGADATPNSWDSFVEDDEHDASPWARAHALRDSVAADFPTWSWAVAQNQRGHYLMWRENMTNLIGQSERWTVEEYFRVR